MEVKSALVNVNSEATLKLLEYVATCARNNDDETVVEESQKLLEEGNTVGMLRLVVKHLHTMLSSSDSESAETDVESSVQLLVAELYSRNLLTDAKVAGPLATELVGKIVSFGEPGDKAALRLRLLSFIFNTLSAYTVMPQLKLDVLLTTISYAASSAQTEPLLEFFSDVEGAISAWKLSPADERKLYAAVAAACATTGDEALAQRMRLKYLALFASSAGDAKALASCKAAALAAAVAAAQNPIEGFRLRQSLVSMTAVQQLEKDPAGKELFALLKILADEKLDAFAAFAKAHGAVLTKHGIDREKLEGEMRLLSICSLATEHEEIPYAAIAATLRVPEEDVEEWVVRAMAADLVSCKMDQLQRVVLISRCMHRRFGKEQWVQLQTKLHSWKANIKTMLTTLRESHVVQASIDARTKV